MSTPEEFIKLQEEIEKLEAENFQLSEGLSDALTQVAKQAEEIEKLKKRAITNLARELSIQCIDYVKRRPGGFAVIPLGYNLREDEGLIAEAEQSIRDKP